MGQSKQKACKLDKFISSLTVDERTVYDLSQRMLDRFILPTKLVGACYRISILMKLILEREYGVSSDVILGYVNDGDNIFISHAWLETGGKKTDLMAERPLVAGRGPTIILDHVFKGTSNVVYTYHLKKTPEALAEDEKMLEKPDWRAALERKVLEHARVAEAITSTEAMAAFLDECAIMGRDGYTYMKVLHTIGR